VVRGGNQQATTQPEENIMLIKNRKNRGFTLVELMIVVAIVGILAALAIYGVRRYISNAKSAEARNTIGQISKDAVTAYQRDNMSGAVLGVGVSTDITNALCQQSSSVPAAATGIQGKKYQSSMTDWGGDATTGWTCLHFSMTDPQYFQYQYTQTGSRTAAGGLFGAVARGDLDADGVLSSFTIAGALTTSGGGSIEALVAPSIAEDQADE
jgi:type IV pilus assembly protein PilA